MPAFQAELVEATYEPENKEPEEGGHENCRKNEVRSLFLERNFNSGPNPTAIFIAVCDEFTNDGADDRQT